MFSYIDEEFGDYFIVDVDGNFFLKQVSFIQEVKKFKKKTTKGKNFTLCNSIATSFFLILDIWIYSLLELHCTAPFQKKT